MKKIVLFLIMLVWASSAGLATTASDAVEVPTITTLMDNGPSSNRINIVFLSEAYVAGQKDRYFSDVNIAVGELFKRSPFLEYKKFFNVHVVWVASKDSVVSVVKYGEETKTYFGRWGTTTSYNVVKIDSVSRSFFSKTDPVVVVLLENDPSFSGEGGQNSGLSIIGIAELGSGRIRSDRTLPDSSWVKEVYASSCPHELGHAFAGLDDEYSGNLAMKPSQTEADFSGANFINVTTETNPKLIKWKYWIDPGIPIPTPASDKYAGVVGLFEGANVYSSGWYRPELKCTMGGYHPDVEARPPFCKVCREAIVKAIYKYANPIADVSTDVGEHITTFNINNMPQPADHSLKMEWLVDDSVAARDVTSLAIVDTEIGYGRHTIKVQVTDETEFVRSDPDGLLQPAVEWNADSFPTPDFDGNNEVDFNDFFVFADVFGRTVAEDTERLSKFDLYMDGKIDFFDFFLFADSFGQRVSEQKISVNPAQ